MRHRRPWLLALGFPALLGILVTGCGDADGTCEVNGELVPVGDVVTVEDGGLCYACVCDDSGGQTCHETACTGRRRPLDDPADTGPDPPDQAPPDQAPPGDDPPDNDMAPGDDPLGHDPPGDDPSTDDSADQRPEEFEPRECPCELGQTTAEAILSAMGICGDDWIVRVEQHGDPRAFGVFTDYFGAIEPRAGSGCLGIISTGEADTGMEGGPTVTDVQPGTAFADEPDPHPHPSNSSDVYDLAYIEVELSPPPEAQGFIFDFVFMTSEWPEWLCSQFNDTYMTLVQTQALPGQHTNISLDRLGNWITVNNAFFEFPPEWTIDLSATPYGLADTGAACALSPDFGDFFPDLDPSCTLPEYCQADSEDCPDWWPAGFPCPDDVDNPDLHYVGSGTGWLRSQAPVNPEEATITLLFSIHDEGDGILDSKVVLDNFRWTHTPPREGTEKY